MPIEPSDACIWGNGFLNRWNTHTHTQTHTTFRAQQKRWVPMWILCSRAQILISFILLLSVCLSLSLRRSEVCKIIHSSSLQSLRSLSGTHAHTHTQEGKTFVPSFIKKNWGIWWLNDPMHPLSLSSRYHIHFMQSSSWALPEGQPLRLTVFSLWLHYHISRDKYKGLGAWHL